MKIFNRCRTYGELKKAAAKLKWHFDDEKFKSGSDYIQVDFKHGKISGTMLISGFNGRFFGKTDKGVEFSSDSTAHERCEWFKQLVNFAYTNSPLPKKDASL